MSKKLISAESLHKKWMRESNYARAVADLEDEYQMASALIAARSEAGLTQQEVAEKMRTSRTAVARLESGKHMPSTKTLVQYGIATGHRVEFTLARISGTGAVKRVASFGSKVLAASALTQAKSKETTSARAASAASKVLNDPKASKAAKTAAASALTQKRK